MITFALEQRVRTALERATGTRRFPVVEVWLTRYGAWALFAIAAPPLPQTPALAFAATARLPVLEVLAALLIGKILKYAVYAWSVARSPEHFARYLRFNSFGAPTAGARTSGHRLRN